jgi:outer membrane autotransporter protein
MRFLGKSGSASSTHPAPAPIVLLASTLAVSAAPAVADDAAFQSFLFDACVSPVGELAARCGETEAGQGGVSGASQSSLNPNQVLANPSSASSFARERARESRSRQDRRIDEDVAERSAVELGRLSLLLNGRTVFQSFEAGDAPTRERGYELRNNNLEVGFDYRVTPRAVVGAWFDWRDSDLEFERAAPVGSLTPDFDAGRVDSDSVGGAIFAGVDLSTALHLDAAVGYSDSEYALERRAVFEPVQAGNPSPAVTVVNTRAGTEGRDRWATLSLGYRIEVESWSFDPFAGVTWSSAEVSGYAEEDLLDSGLAMDVGRVETDAVTASLGFDARRVVSLPSAVLVPQLHFEYGYGLDVDATEAFATFLLDAAGTRLGLASDEPDRDFARAGIGVVAIFQHGWSVFLDLQSTIGVEHVDRYAIAAGIRREL